MAPRDRPCRRIDARWLLLLVPATACQTSLVAPVDLPPVDLATLPDLTAAPPPVDLALLAEPLSFAALGDVPYEHAEEDLLRRDVAALDPKLPFALHLGDIKPSAWPCDEAPYRTAAAILGASQVPFFIVVGDNEWSECADPAAGWGLWTKHFLHFERRWQLPFAVLNDPQRAESFAFLHRGVLVIGLTLVGGTVHDAAEWRQRHARNLAFVKERLAADGDKVRAVVIAAQAVPVGATLDFFTPLQAEAVRFGKPMIYLHGDAHLYYCARFGTARNLYDIEVDRGGKAPPLVITMTTDPADPFLIDRQAAGAPGVLLHARDCK